MPLRARVINSRLEPVPVRGEGSVVWGTQNGLNPAVIAAAADYAALDVLSNSTTNNAGLPWVVQGVARENGGAGFITKVMMTFSADTMVARIRLLLFNIHPSTSTEMDDNAAFTMAAVDRLRYIGRIDLPALADYGALSITEDNTLRVPFRCAAADNALYIIAQFLDAETNEVANMTATMLVQTLWD